MSGYSTVYEFVGIGEMAETTTQLLSLTLRSGIQESRRTPRHTPGVAHVTQLVLQQARDYLARVREGFVLSVRTAQMTDRQELQYLLDRVLVDWTELSAELGLVEEDATTKAATRTVDNRVGDPSRAHQLPAAEQPGTTAQLEYVRTQLMAYGMALVALGHLPGLPAAQITFPHSYTEPPSYSDILAPHSPGEILWRIEEVEEILWQVMASDPGELVSRRYGSVRRTYGFFEASAWLARREAERFGIKRRQTELSLL